MKKIKKAVFPVGGMGTRFLPATKSIPKEMLPVAAKPLIQYAYEEAVEAGIEEFIFITGRNKNTINNHFNHAFELQNILSRDEKENMLAQVRDWIPDAGKIMFIAQQDPLGLGHAIWSARYIVKDEPFAVILPDEMVLSEKGALKQMLENYNYDDKFNMVAVAKIDPKDSNKYGIIKIDEKKSANNLLNIIDLVEKPQIKDAPSNYALTGRYIFRPEIIDYLGKQVSSYKKHLHKGEIQITQAIKEMLGNTACKAYEFSGERFDCGSLVGFLEANIAYSLKNKEIAARVKQMLKKYSN